MIKFAVPKQTSSPVLTQLCEQLIRSIAIVILLLGIYSPMAQQVGVPEQPPIPITAPPEKPLAIGDIHQLFVLPGSSNSVVVAATKLSVQTPLGLDAQVFVANDRVITVYAESMPPAFTITLSGTSIETGNRVSEQILV